MSSRDSQKNLYVVRKLSVVLFDEDLRLVFCSYVEPPLKLVDITGTTPWDPSLVDAVNGERLRAGWAEAEQTGRSVVIDTITPNIGMWRATIYPVRGLPGIRACFVVYQLPEWLPALTAREREICTLIADGRSHKEIARLAKIRLSTVGNHRAKIAAKLGVPTAGLDVFIGSHWQTFATLPAISGGNR